MEEAILPLSSKVQECHEKGHHLMKIREGDNWYCACHECHYVAELHCVDQQHMISLHS